MPRSAQHSPANNSPVYPYVADIPHEQIAGDAGNERPGLAARVAAVWATWATLDPNERILALKDLGLDDLVSSITSPLGLLEPVIVYEVETGRFLVKSGHRRFFALRFAGAATIPCVVEAPPSTQSQQDLARIGANLLRADIDAISLARGIAALLAGDPSLTQAKVGAMLGRSQSNIANMLRLLDLPAPVITLIEAGTLNAGHGLELLSIQAPELDYNDKEIAVADVQSRFAGEIAESGEGVRRLRERIKSWREMRRYRREDAARQTKWRAEAAARLAATQAPQTRTAEEQAAAEAEVQRQAAEKAKEQETAGRRDERLAQRALVAGEVIDQAIGYVAGAPPTVELLRLAARAALAGCDGSDYHWRLDSLIRDSFLRQILAATDQATLLDILVRIARAALRLDPDRRNLQGNYDVDKWADSRYFLNVRIADALKREKLIPTNSHKALVEGKPTPPTATPATAIAVESAPPEPPCPSCGKPLIVEQAEGDRWWTCLDCTQIYYADELAQPPAPTESAPAPTCPICHAALCPIPGSAILACPDVGGCGRYWEPDADGALYMVPLVNGILAQQAAGVPV